MQSYEFAVQTVMLRQEFIFEIKSKWYGQNPLIIRGPGAGREVTAGAIQSDLMRLEKTIFI